MCTPGIMQATSGMKNDGPAAGVRVKTMRAVVLMFPMSMELVYGKKKAQCMRALFITKFMINKAQQKRLFEIQSRKEFAPELPGDYAIGM